MQSSFFNFSQGIFFFVFNDLSSVGWMGGWMDGLFVYLID